MGNKNEFFIVTQMDIETNKMDEDRHPESGLTEEERNENFVKVFTVCEYLDEGGAITLDVMREYMDLVDLYRGWIPDFSLINGEIKDAEFRKCCSETETLLRQLDHSSRHTNTINIKLFHIFMKHMKQILETIFTDDQLADLLSGMSL